MVWVIAFGELFFGDLWCVVWGYGGMRTHFSLLNPWVKSRVVSCRPESATIAEHCSALLGVAAELRACGECVAVLKVPNS